MDLITENLPVVAAGVTVAALYLLTSKSVSDKQEEKKISNNKKRIDIRSKPINKQKYNASQPGCPPACLSKQIPLSNSLALAHLVVV
jgi:hypothetical protein